MERRSKSVSFKATKRNAKPIKFDFGKPLEQGWNCRICNWNYETEEEAKEHVKTHTIGELLAVVGENRPSLEKLLLDGSIWEF